MQLVSYYSDANETSRDLGRILVFSEYGGLKLPALYQNIQWKTTLDRFNDGDTSWSFDNHTIQRTLRKIYTYRWYEMDFPYFFYINGWLKLSLLDKNRQKFR